MRHYEFVAINNDCEEPRQNVLSALHCTALCLIASLVTIAVSSIWMPYKTTLRLSSVFSSQAYSLPADPLLR
jgi:hypothetical protein